MGKQNRNFQNRPKTSYKKPYYNKNFPRNKTEDGLANKKHEYVVKDNLREDQVGITEYVYKGEGFKGILKSRFSDFHVNEIDLGGKVLQLNDLTIPDETKEKLNTEEINFAREEFKNIVSESTWDQMNKLKEAKHDNNKKPQDSAIFIDVSELNKEERTRLHKLIKTIYEEKLLTCTVSGEHADSKNPDQKLIRVMKRTSLPDRNKWAFPKEYVHFLVHKENLDTSEVASAIANKMGIRASQVNYCGTKDKRAKTTQKFCIRKRNPRQIAGTVKFLNGVKIGNFHFKKSVLKLGDLHGNRFRIAIRNLVGDRQHIESVLNCVKEKGFINYFGMQRFGNCSAIPTYEIGVALVKADYKLACELILKPRENDVPYMKSIREMWWKNRDSKAAAAQFRNNSIIEKKLLDGLAQFGENDYAAALRKIPRNMLLLYPHAFQSLLFNIIASKRIREFGLSLIPGDLVYRYKDYQEGITESTELADQEEVTIKKEIEDQTEYEEQIESTTAPSDNDRSQGSFFRRKVKHLTEEDIASGTYSIYDVLLPLAGHDVMYPCNIVGTWYEELLETYNLSSEQLKHNVKIFSMAGAYRRLVVKPRDMSWEFKSYASPDETLILSDIELLEGKKLEDFKKAGSNFQYEALILDFCLPTASYATMMLRELLKSDTSAAAQSLLQQAALKEHTDIKQNIEDTKSHGEKRKCDDNENEGQESAKPTAKLSKEA